MNKINKKIFGVVIIIVIIILAFVLIYFKRDKSLDVITKTPQGLFLEVNLSEEARINFEERRNTNLEELELFPNNYNAYLDLGNIERELGNASLSIDYFKKASEIIPANSTSWLNIGNVYYRLAMYDESIESFEVARTKAPDYYLVYFNLAKVYKAQDSSNTQRVMDIFEEGVEKTNNDYKIIYFYASYLREIGNYQKALEYLELFTKFAPDQNMIDTVNLEIEEVKGILGQ